MKKLPKKLSTLLVGAAVAGLMTATTTLTSCSGGSTAPAGKNGCNGPNGCASKDRKEANGCSGPNGCNGHGTKEPKKS